MTDWLTEYLEMDIYIERIEAETYPPTPTTVPAKIPPLDHFACPANVALNDRSVEVALLLPVRRLWTPRQLLF